MSEPRIAKTVAFNADECVFDVDGEPFPWHLPENAQPTARKILDDAYVVAVEFYPILRGHEKSPCAFEHTEWTRPFICGVEFPWWIADTGVTYAVSGGDIGCVSLGFFTESVEGMAVTDAVADGDVKVRELSGRLIARMNARATA